MLLLTGATGLVGRALLARLTAAGTPVRCLVRDPRRLGRERVRVQIALGDLADPQSFRNALRGIDVVVHLAATIRDQPRGSIEELNGIATWRMVEAAGRAGVERFVFFSALGASAHDRTRLLRAKAVAEQAVRDGPVRSLIIAPSLIYAPGDPRLRKLAWLSHLPVMPISGRGRSRYQPIWAQDAVECVLRLLAEPGTGVHSERWELAGPQTLTHAEIVRLALRSFGRRRLLLPVPTRVVAASLRALEAIAKNRAFATWDEAELLEVSMVTPHGSAAAERLGVFPRPMAAVLGVR